jgi:hypothetical protein
MNFRRIADSVGHRTIDQDAGTGTPLGGWKAHFKLLLFDSISGHETLRRRVSIKSTFDRDPPGDAHGIRLPVKIPRVSGIQVTQRLYLVGDCKEFKRVA